MDIFFVLNSSFFIFLIILGIDPGSAVIGYAILEYNHPIATLKTADFINLTSTPPADRLLSLHKELTAVIKKWDPRCAAIEELFFSKNVKTALTVSESRGVIMLTTLLAGLTVFEYTPLEIKQTVTGDGRADKEQVKKMVRISLKETRSMRMRDDVFDAIAIALTCAWREHNSFHN